MYDISKRKRFLDIKVGDLIEVLKGMPQKAIVHVCGSSLLYIHVEEDGSIITLDCEALEDEYDEDEYDEDG